MGEDSGISIRSFRVCFKFERRIHKLDRWQIPVPFGLPLRGVGYVLILLLTLLISSRLPLLGAVVTALPAPLRFVLLPLGGGYFLYRWELDGRPAHATAIAWVRLRLAPSRISAFRRIEAPGVVSLADVTLVPDEHVARLRPAIITGPAEVIFRYPFKARARRRTLRVVPEQGPPQWQGKQVRLRLDQRVVIR